MTTATTSAGRRLATLTFLPHRRLTPTAKIRTDPTRDRFVIAASVMSGCRSRARAVMQPCTTATGIAENAQPFPIEADITRTMIKSMTALANRIEWSPYMPSWIEPMTAMAPIQTVSEAVTKAFTEFLSRAFPV